MAIVTAEEVLSKILANACPSKLLDGEYKLFLIETHCVNWHVQAKIIQEPSDDQGWLFEVRSIEPVNEVVYDD